MIMLQRILPSFESTQRVTELRPSFLPQPLPGNIHPIHIYQAFTQCAKNYAKAKSRENTKISLCIMSMQDSKRGSQGPKAKRKSKSQIGERS